MMEQVMRVCVPGLSEMGNVLSAAMTFKMAPRESEEPALR